MENGVLYTLEKPRGCKCLCSNDFYRAELFTSIPAPTLTNEVHPLFSREKLECLHSRTPDGEIIHHAAQLATNLLEASLPFFFVIFYSGTTQIENAQDGQRQWQFLDKIEYTEDNPEGLTAAQQAVTRDRLTELADLIQYTTAEPQDGDKIERDGGGSTQQEGWIHGLLWFGVKSTITISPTFVRNLRRHQNIATTDGLNYHWHAFCLAQTMVHEITHAAINAWHGQMLGENRFFHGSDIAEDGFDWQAQTFGGLLVRSGPSLFHDSGCVCEGLAIPLLYGTIHARKPVDEFRLNDITSIDFEGMITSIKWPDFNYVQYYLTNGHPVGVRPTATFPEERLVLNVEFKDIHRLLQQEFYEDGSFRRFQALWPKRTTATWIPNCPARYYSTGGAPKGYTANSVGLIYRTKFEDDLFDGSFDPNSHLYVKSRESDSMLDDSEMANGGAGPEEALQQHVTHASSSGTFGPTCDPTLTTEPLDNDQDVQTVGGGEGVKKRKCCMGGTTSRHSEFCIRVLMDLSDSEDGTPPPEQITANEDVDMGGDSDMMGMADEDFQEWSIEDAYTYFPPA